ncbi:MAG TPA: WhiB family transcriptional regulator [Actinomycetota bacterium]|nr:WhiB family transcriptional regulator [Actinomycetota bacterium]
MKQGDQDWRAEGLCAERDPDLWFAIGALEHRQAKRICRDCPVQRECLSYAMDHPVDHGIWGGMTERERLRWRRKAGQAGWRSLIAS